jgi:predicted house-cleaning noncanonical NTP pyrophosphatase (MazG superfamily)
VVSVDAFWQLKLDLNIFPALLVNGDAMTGHEGVIEGRPEIQFDWQKQYADQRKERLADSVHEYLEDDEVSILTFYNDLKDCVEEIITYHKKNKEKAQGALQLILGHRVPVDGLDDVGGC